MVKMIYEILDEVNKKRHKADNVEILKKNESWALKDIIRGSMDSTVKWSLPPGKPPYTPSDGHNHPSHLLKENTKFKYFVKGGQGDKMPKYKREQIFIGILEGVHPEDAKVVLSMINKEKFKGITEPVVKEAFPNLL